MYCVIQKVKTKKPNQYGYHKHLEITETNWSFLGGENETKYGYSYSEERFDRPIKDSYKISIHKSYRENGKVKKQQVVICTMSYYDLPEHWVGDCVSSGALKTKLERLQITEEELWNMVCEKLDPIAQEIEREFENTEEYKAQQEHRRILREYEAAKRKFEDVYGEGTYDYCYNIYGELQNAEYLQGVKVKRRQQESYSWGGYQGNNYSNYNDSFGGSYSKSKQSTYTEDEKGKLKKIYREAAKKFHPDVTKDDGEMMKFLTKLKEEWGI